MFFITWMGFLAVNTSMAEMGSMAYVTSIPIYGNVLIMNVVQHPEANTTGSQSLRPANTSNPSAM